MSDGSKVEVDDPLQTKVATHSYWTTTNTEEAHPGVLTPLGWTVAGAGIECSVRGSLRAIGVLAPKEAALPERAEDRIFVAFGGRFAARLDFFVDVGNRLPGTSGPALVDQIFSFVPPGASAAPDRSRYAAVGLRLPASFATSPRRARRVREITASWWATETTRSSRLGLDAARRQFSAGNDQFNAVGLIDALVLLAAIQPVYDQLARLADAAGVPSGPLMSGHGSHEESQMVANIWACSRGRLDADALVRRYGFHGPRTGELSAPTWREEPTPLKAAIEQYRALPDDSDPAAAEVEHAARRVLAERQLVAALPIHRRPAAHILLQMARRYLPLRGKVGRTQALDVMRAAARRVGELLSIEGVIGEPEDVFMLTADELSGQMPADPKMTIAARRERYDLYRTQDLPRVWKGNPDPIPLGDPLTDERTASLQGVAASPGLVEGRARVITDPATLDIEAGEVLIAYTTDPSWAAAIFLSSALVVDVGGLLSHAAVVARELGVPCVMDTKSGTTDIRTGDLCRVDGTAGSVEILERATHT